MRVYKKDDHRGWGNSIQIRKWEQPHGRVVGWLRRKPKRGDILTVRGSSGIMVCEFKKVGCCGDPPDMFFADIEYLAHLLDPAEEEAFYAEPEKHMVAIRREKVRHTKESSRLWRVVRWLRGCRAS